MRDDFKPMSDAEWEAKKSKERGQTLTEHNVFCVMLSLVFGAIESVILGQWQAVQDSVMIAVLCVPVILWLIMLGVQRRRLIKNGVVPTGFGYAVAMICALLAFCLGLTFGGRGADWLYAFLINMGF